MDDLSLIRVVSASPNRAQISPIEWDSFASKYVVKSAAKKKIKYAAEILKEFCCGIGADFSVTVVYTAPMQTCVSMVTDANKPCVVLYNTTQIYT